MKSFRILFAAVVVVMVLCASAFAADTLYVRDISVSFITKDGATTVEATVKVKGAQGSNLTGVFVEGNIWVDIGMGDYKVISGYTNSKGIVVFEFPYMWEFAKGTTATFCVDNLSRDGDVYDPSLNWEDCDTGRKR